MKPITRNTLIVLILALSLSPFLYHRAQNELSTQTVQREAALAGKVHAYETLLERVEAQAPQVLALYQKAQGSKDERLKRRLYDRIEPLQNEALQLRRLLRDIKADPAFSQNWMEANYTPVRYALVEMGLVQRPLDLPLQGDPEQDLYRIELKHLLPLR